MNLALLIYLDFMYINYESHHNRSILKLQKNEKVKNRIPRDNNFSSITIQKKYSIVTYKFMICLEFLNDMWASVTGTYFSSCMWQ